MTSNSADPSSSYRYLVGSVFGVAVSPARTSSAKLIAGGAKLIAAGSGKLLRNRLARGTTGLGLTGPRSMFARGIAELSNRRPFHESTICAVRETMLPMRRFGLTSIELRQGDITTFAYDAI